MNEDVSTLRSRSVITSIVDPQMLQLFKLQICVRRITYTVRVRTHMYIHVPIHDTPVACLSFLFSDMLLLLILAARYMSDVSNNVYPLCTVFIVPHV